MQELELKLSDLFATVPLALVIYISDLPWLGELRIDAIALLVLLFALYRPAGISLWLAFALGVFQDLASMALLGQHGIGLAVTAYLGQRFRERVLIQSPFGQLPYVFGMLLFLELTKSWALALSFGTLPTLWTLYSVLCTALLWPVIPGLATRLVGRRVRQYDRRYG